MRIAAHRGSRLHAPENSRIALVSGYTGGADVLELDVQITKDGFLAVSHDGTVDRLTGASGVISEMKLAALRQLDFSKTFQPRGGTNFHFFDATKPGRRLQIETLPELVDYLPDDVELLLELKHDSSLHTGRRQEFVNAAIATLVERDRLDRTVLYSKDPENLRLARQLAPELRLCAFDSEAPPAQRLQLVTSLGADGLVTDLESVLGANGALTAFGRDLEALCEDRQLKIGAVLYPSRRPGVFRQDEFDALRKMEFVWSVSTDSMIDIEGFARRGVSMIEAIFAGTEVDTERFALGYAKANRFGNVFQKDGIHVDIKPYDDGAPSPPTSDLERRIAALESDLMYAAKDWPFYSGGGVGAVRGIRGDFVAEVDYAVENVAQATTLEMAVLNVDPGAHQPKPPTSFRGKDSFYDPHGAPPYVGVEHDEDDGYRINWNLGSEYDSNQYGKPVGDGKTPRAARLRLERRGPYFSAFYKNAVDAPDWVCVGVVRNDSLNPVVYLRCVGKRWRQEDEQNPEKFSPIIANHFTFTNLTVTRYRR
jgi:glycerophosphoryl diester phosphodiesterase